MNKNKFLTVELDEEEARYIFPKSTMSKFGRNNEYLVYIDKSDFDKVFEFSYAMTFGRKGGHNSSSFTRDSGYRRRLGEIFVNTFQGKISELATYRYCQQKNYQCGNVDFSIGGLDYWDNIDLEINQKNVSIKSTKGYSMFLLLEVQNYDKSGNYIYPYDGQSNVDFFLLCRVQSKLGKNVENVLKSNSWLYSSKVNKKRLYNELNNQDWIVELSGFISKKKLVEYVIKEGHVMKKGYKMGKSNETMKVDNYYVHVSDLAFLQNK